MKVTNLTTSMRLFCEIKNLQMLPIMVKTSSMSFAWSVLLLCHCKSITGIVYLILYNMAKFKANSDTQSTSFMMVHIGTASISPSHMASVCRGDQLELICTTTGRFLEWSFSLVSTGETTTVTRYLRVLSTSAVVSWISPVIVANSSFTFSRISVQNTLPLISRLLINPVSAELNGTVVNCTDIVETSETASTLVQIINEDLIFGMLQKLN